MEIERRWLFNNVIIPGDIPLIKKGRYGQAYLNFNPELRIRWKRDEDNRITYKLCIKSKGLLERIEVEKDLTEEEFVLLLTVGGIDANDIILKNISIYKLQEYELTVADTDICRDTRFSYAEIEFPSIHEANTFIPPNWFGTEITYEQGRNMADYWMQTRGIRKNETA
jgi:CYTH domain-containing protein